VTQPLANGYLLLPGREVTLPCRGLQSIQAASESLFLGSARRGTPLGNARASGACSPEEEVQEAGQAMEELLAQPELV